MDDERSDDASYDAAWKDALRPWWHVVARSEDLGPNSLLAVELLGERHVLWRSGSGVPTLAPDRCPHRGVALSLGRVDESGCLECAYHAWSFDPTGRCASIPQLGGDHTLPGAALTTCRVAERYGFVWACLVSDEDERGGIPPFAELDAGTHWFWMGWTHDWAAQSFRQMENFCDVAHFAVLHADTFGHPSARAVQPDPPVRDGRSLRFRFDTPVCDPSQRGGAARPTFPGWFDYAVTLPSTIHLGGASGPDTVMFVHSTPLDVYRTRVFWGCAFPNGTEIDRDQYAAIEGAIWSPDRAMVESQTPRGLALERTADVNLPHDRFSIAFREALAELGVPSSNPADRR